jgi:magnesium-transporting ATPase (P-type)
MNKFDHERRCMSTLVQCPGGRLLLLMKGADSSVIPLGAHAKAAAQHNAHVRFFATQGLRTLVSGRNE